MNNENLDIVLLYFNDPKLDNYVLNKINEVNGFKAYCILKHTNKFIAGIRKLHLRFKLPFIHFWFTDWYKKIKDNQKIVIFGTNYSKVIINYIKNNFKNMYLVNCYVDSFSISDFDLCTSKDFKTFTFFKNDAEKYNINYCRGFIVPNVVHFNKYSEKIYDISFIGADRNGKLKLRTELADYYYEYFKKLGLNTFFYYVSNDKNSNKEFTNQKRLTETEFFNIIEKSKCILDLINLDISPTNQRLFYSLAAGVKYITNSNMTIPENLYNKNNIYILGKDKRDLKEFINIPFEKLSDEVLEYYSLKEWSIELFGD